jgi:hypothetical protein
MWHDVKIEKFYRANELGLGVVLTWQGCLSKLGRSRDLWLSVQVLCWTWQLRVLTFREN